MGKGGGRGVHSEGVYKGLYPAFGARKRRLGLCVFASVLCVNLILLSFSILSFCFFPHIYSTSMLQIEVLFFSFVLFVFFEEKSFAGCLGGRRRRREYSGNIRGRRGVGFRTGREEGCLFFSLMCFQAISQRLYSFILFSILSPYAS